MSQSVCVSAFQSFLYFIHVLIRKYLPFLGHQFLYYIFLHQQLKYPWLFDLDTICLYLQATHYHLQVSSMLQQ